MVGVDPESTTNDFKITSFPMKDAASLDGEWQAVTEENKAEFRFFKVEVVLP